MADAASGADCLEYFAGLIAVDTGQYIDLGSSFAYTRREPLGVCAAIGAWNYPIQIACWKAAPALAAGNAMVFKPSELTPLSALALAEILDQPGSPPASSTSCREPATWAPRCAHPAVAKVSVTGSVRDRGACGTGRRRGPQARDTRTRRQVTADRVRRRRPRQRRLGRDARQLLLDRAGLLERHACVRAARGARRSSSTGSSPAPSGSCSATRSTRRRRWARSSSERQLERVLDYVDAGRAEGARCVCRRAAARRGRAVRKASSCDPPCSSTSPTRCGSPARRSSDRSCACSPSTARTRWSPAPTPPSSASRPGVFTRDIQRAHRVIAALEAGTCWINTYNLTPIAMPFGGYKRSGIGRENGSRRRSTSTASGRASTSRWATSRRPTESRLATTRGPASSATSGSVSNATRSSVLAVVAQLAACTGEGAADGHDGRSPLLEPTCCVGVPT